MTAKTLAGRLVSAFGDADTMATLYAPEIRWYLKGGDAFPYPIAGRDAVIGFNREVWSTYYDADCQVEILDETGDDTISAVRFIYRAFAKLPQKPYENEYSVFVRSDPDGITDVFESFDTSVVSELYADMNVR